MTTKPQAGLGGVMANCIAECYGYDKSRVKEDHRLGSEGAKAIAATWDTRATAYIAKDGSGYVSVQGKNGETIHHFDFGPESER